MNQPAYDHRDIVVDRSNFLSGVGHRYALLGLTLLIHALAFWILADFIIFRSNLSKSNDAVFQSVPASAVRSTPPPAPMDGNISVPVQQPLLTAPPAVITVPQFRIEFQVPKMGVPQARDIAAELPLLMSDERSAGHSDAGSVGAGKNVFDGNLDGIKRIDISDEESGDPAPIGSVTWEGATFTPAYLGKMELHEEIFAKVDHCLRGLAFQPDGDLLATVGNGSSQPMEIEKWHGTDSSTLVNFHDYFWFFAGPIAVTSDNQIYFSLGACASNGLFHLAQINPMKVKICRPQNRECMSLQFFPADSQDLYLSDFLHIEKIQLGGVSSQDSPYFSLNANGVFIDRPFLLDEDHLVATVGFSAKTHRVEPKTVAVVFDRRKKGYYLFNIDQWGPIAIRPADHALFRFARDAREIRQFTLAF